LKRALIVLALLALLPATGSGFVLLPFLWPEPSTVVFNGGFDLPFRNAFSNAADDWNAATEFRFEVDGSERGACDTDGNLLNGAEFFADDCDGFALGPRVLAITEFEVFGNEITAVGVTFNSDDTWSVYDGPWRADEADFRRVALHELGHVLGLGHEDSTPAIMASFISSRFTLAPDDIAGAAALYGTPVDPELVCARKQLRAAGRLCRRQLRCDARLAASANEPSAAAERAACVLSAADRFATSWERSIQRAAAASSRCHQTESAERAGAPVVVAAQAISDAIGAEATGDAEERGLRGHLLKRTASLCRQDFAAHRRDVLRDNAAQLTRRLEAARDRYLKRSGRVLERATARGTPYGGATPEQIAPLPEDLAASVAATVRTP